MHLPLANLFGIENWGVIALFALLLFGRRLPEVGRSLGKGITEFKKGLAGIEEEINTPVTSVQDRPQIAAPTTTAPQQALPAGYKFDPYTGKPIDGMRFDPYTGKPLNAEASSTTTNA